MVPGGPGDPRQPTLRPRTDTRPTLPCASTLADGIRAEDDRAHDHRPRGRRRGCRTARPRPRLARALPGRPGGQPPLRPRHPAPAARRAARRLLGRGAGRAEHVHRHDERRGGRAADARGQRHPPRARRPGGRAVRPRHGRRRAHRPAAAHRAARLLRLVDRPDGACTPTPPTRSPTTRGCRTGTGTGRFAAEPAAPRVRGRRSRSRRRRAATPVTLALSTPTRVPTLPGESQYSALSPSTRITATRGSSGSHWNQASAKSFHSSRALAASEVTDALPATDTHLPSSVNATLTSGRRRISSVFSESREGEEPQRAVGVGLLAGHRAGRQGAPLVVDGGQHRRALVLDQVVHVLGAVVVVGHRCSFDRARPGVQPDVRSGADAGWAVTSANPQVRRGGCRRLRSGLERAQVLGHVDGVLLQRGQRDDAQHRLVGRGEHDRRRDPLGVGARPVGGRDAPAVAGDQAREAVRRHRRRQVVADGALVLEELGGDDRADGVAAQVLRAGAAAPVAVEAGHRVGAARLELAAEDVAFAHAPAWPNRALAATGSPEDSRSRRPGRCHARSAEAPGRSGAATAAGAVLLALTGCSVRASTGNLRGRPVGGGGGPAGGLRGPDRLLPRARGRRAGAHRRHPRDRQRARLPGVGLLRQLPPAAFDDGGCVDPISVSTMDWRPDGTGVTCQRLEPQLGVPAVLLSGELILFTGRAQVSVLDARGPADDDGHRGLALLKDLRAIGAGSPSAPSPRPTRRSPTGSTTSAARCRAETVDHPIGEPS